VPEPVIDASTAADLRAAGVTDAVTLHAELQALGFTGSVQTVRRYLRPLRTTQASASSTVSPRPAVPKPRQVVRWTMTEPGKLDLDEQTQLTDVLAGCPHLHATTDHVRNLADLMHKHRGDRLPQWMKQVEADDLPALHSLVTGFRRDLAAVTAGITLPWSSGAVEGNVNRIIPWNQSWSMDAADSFGAGVGGSTVRGSRLPGSARSWFGVGPAGVATSARRCRRPSTAA
jgi:transposase